MADTNEGPCRRSALETNGFEAKKIPGVRTCDTADFFGEIWPAIEKGTKDTYTHDEIYGEFCNVNLFVEAPFDMVFDYLSNVYSLEEWTVSLRGFRYVGGGIYRGYDSIATREAENTPIYMKFESYRNPGVVDHLCAWDQGEELWMRYHFRLVDGMRTVRRAGTVVSWFNARHPYYFHDTQAPKYIEEHRARKDRSWVGDLWNHFHSGHSFEARNMKTILEYRWKNAGKGAGAPGA